MNDANLDDNYSTHSTHSPYPFACEPLTMAVPLFLGGGGLLFLSSLLGQNTYSSVPLIRPVSSQDSHSLALGTLGFFVSFVHHLLRYRIVTSAQRGFAGLLFLPPPPLIECGMLLRDSENKS